MHIKKEVAKLLRRLEKVLLISFLVVVLVTFSFVVAAVSYQEARENELLRTEYVNRLTEKYPPPKDSNNIKYTTKDNETATMTVSYRPFMIGDMEIKLGLVLTVYPQAFECYSNEDDFISTLFHEYNHLRALDRKEVVEENNFYMPKSNKLSSVMNANYLDSGQNDLKIYSNIIEKLKWDDLFILDYYDSSLLDSDDKNRNRQILNYFIRNPIMEMLAIEEEIYRHNFGLNPSSGFRKARYTTYSFYYHALMTNLETLNAAPKLTNTLEKLFHRKWMEVKKEKAKINFIDMVKNSD